MSRMRAMLFGLVAGIMGSSKILQGEKEARIKDLNKGGYLYANPYGPKRLNQRQKRKRLASNPHLRK